MSTCICSTCKNLKTIVETDESGVSEACEFGFPSESCLDCEDTDCELSCEHYIEDCTEEAFSLSACSTCGKELKITASNVEAGEVYCPTCYLEKLF